MTVLTKLVKRVTLTELDGSFGLDRNKRIVVSLIPDNGAGTPDMVSLRPERSRRPELIAVADVYRFALKARVNRSLLERARARKAKKAERLARLRQERAEKRVVS